MKKFLPFTEVLVVENDPNYGVISVYVAKVVDHTDAGVTIEVGDGERRVNQVNVFNLYERLKIQASVDPAEIYVKCNKSYI